MPKRTDISLKLIIGAAAVSYGLGLVATPLKAAPLADDFEFAKATVGKFKLRATTDVRWTGDRPYVQNIECVGDNGHVSFVVDQNAALAQLRLSFLGPPASDGEAEQITLLGDRLRLFVDGEQFEYQNIAWPGPQFANYPYPAAAPGEIILPVWRGYPAVRRTNSEPFVDLSRIYGKLVDARRIEWSFVSRDWSKVDQSQPENALPAGWRSRRYPIDLGGLKPALDWCSRAVTSPQARRLPPHLASKAQR